MMAAIPVLNYHRNGINQNARQTRPGLLQPGIRFNGGPNGGAEDKLDTSPAAGPKPPFRINAMEKPELLERSKQIDAAHDFLMTMAEKPAPYPAEMKVEVTVPEAKMKELEERLERLNRVVKSEGWSGKLKHAGFRTLSGVQGELHPVLYHRDELDPKKTMHMHLNFSGVSKDDLVNFASFLKRFRWT